MKFLNGFKTIIGAVGLAVVALADASVIVLVPEKARPYITGAAAMLTALGLIHKKEKADEKKEGEESKP